MIKKETIDGFMDNVAKGLGEDSDCYIGNNYIDRLCWFSLLKICCSTKRVEIPFITNHKFFYSNHAYDYYIRNDDFFESVFRFLILASKKDTKYLSEHYSEIYTQQEFDDKVFSEKDLFEIDDKNTIATFLQNIYETSDRPIITYEVYYKLFTLEVLDFLISQKKDINFSNRLDVGYCDMLCSKILYLPNECKSNMYLFVYTYLMNQEQREINNSAYEAVLKMKSKKLDYNSIMCTLYDGLPLNQDLERQFDLFFTKAYSLVNLQFNNSNSLNYQDLLLLVIWKMLYRDKKCTNDEVKSNANAEKKKTRRCTDDYLNFNMIISKPFNFLLLFNELSFDRLNDGYTLLEPVNPNYYQVFYTLIGNAPTDEGSIWSVDYFGELYRLFKVLENNSDQNKLKTYESLLSKNLEEFASSVVKTSPPKMIISEFKYKLLYFRKLSALKLQMKLYEDVKESQKNFKPMGECDAIHSEERYNYKDIDREFLKKHQMWKILSDKSEETDDETQNNLLKKLSDSLHTFHAVMELISNGQKLPLSQYCVIFWLIRNGNDIMITFAENYKEQKNSEKSDIPMVKTKKKSLSAILKNGMDAGSTNKWFSIEVITSFIVAYSEMNANPEELKKFDDVYELYRITCEQLTQKLKDLTPSQAMKAWLNTTTVLLEHFEK